MPQPRTFTVSEDDDGIRLDRWVKRHMPDVSFNLVSRWARTGQPRLAGKDAVAGGRNEAWTRTGQLRLAGKRAVPGDRIEAGQEIRVPPLEAQPERSAKPQRRREELTDDEAQFVREMVIHSDANAFVLNKP